MPVEVVNGLGAEDAFGGALCHGLLTGLPLAGRAVRPDCWGRTSPLGPGPHL